MKYTKFIDVMRNPLRYYFAGIQYVKSFALLKNRPIDNETYEILYESHAKALRGSDAIGDGDFDLVGKIELDLLKMEGLKPDHTLIDFGCGIGRLGIQVIPYLYDGTYVGIDISKSLLNRAGSFLESVTAQSKCTVKLQHQSSDVFKFESKSIDMICAFSVFTHMEHEDTFRYLKNALSIVKPGGKFILSCLPISSADSKKIFLLEAEHDLKHRWSRVRNVITSKELITEIAVLAGWKVLHWYDGDKQNIGLPASEMKALGQSSCVLEAP